MCELHFTEDDFKRETLAFDEQTGRRVTAPLKISLLYPEAIPSILPNCLSYLSTHRHSRPTPDSRREKKEEIAIRKAILQSVADEDLYRRDREFSVHELEQKLKFIDKTYWTVIRKEDSLLICRVLEAPCPSILLSVVVKPTCAVQVFLKDAEVHKLGNYKIPSTINDTNSLDEWLQNVRQFDTENQSANSCNPITIIQLVLSLLTIIQNESFQHLATLKVVCEQLYLMTLKKLHYSAEFLIFLSLLCNCSPQGYRLLRERKFFYLARILHN